MLALAEVHEQVLGPRDEGEWSEKGNENLKKEIESLKRS